MRIAVFGLGYVGVVSASCLADQGHQIIGVDISSAKVDAIKAGRSPIVEPEVEALLAESVRSGRLTATDDWRRAVNDTDMAWLCVSTPSLPNGNIDRRHLGTVGEEIGQALRDRSDRYTVVVRSTALPGTTRDALVPRIEQHSGRRLGDGWGVCYHPEFLREGTSVQDFSTPSKIVIGASDPEAETLLASLYTGSPAPFVCCTIEVAEMVKYADNAWHALKVAFANEIGTVCKEVGLDGRRVMEIFCLDRKLNLSEKYLRPGFAFGGSCLPKDLRALAYEGRRLDLTLPLVEAVLPSNQRHLERALRLIADAGSRNVGLLGLSFKPDTDDLRESPFVELAEQLIGKGFRLRVFDPHVNMAMVAGANRQYIDTRIPHIASLLVNGLDELLAESEVVVIGHLEPGQREAFRARLGRRTVVDLAGTLADTRPDGTYRGICW